MDDFLTTSEAARFLGVCEATVRRLHGRGELKAHRDHFGYRKFLNQDLKELRDRRSTLKTEAEDHKKLEG